MLFVLSAFLLWSIRCYIWLQNCFASFASSYWQIFTHSPPTFLSLFWNVLFCLICLILSPYLLSLPSFASTFWFISSSCIVCSSCVTLLISSQHILSFFLCLCIFYCCHRFLICVSSLISHPSLEFLFLFFRNSTERLNTEKPEPTNRIETPNNSNRNNTHPNTTEKTLTQEEKNNVEILKRIMSKKKTTLSSLRQPDLVMVNKIKENLPNSGLCCSSWSQEKVKEREKSIRYLELAREQKKLRNGKVTVTPIVNCVLGTFTKRYKGWRTWK